MWRGAKLVSLVVSIAVLHLTLAEPAEAFRGELDAEVLGVECNVYVLVPPSDGLPWPSWRGEDCVARLLVAYRGAPYRGLAPSAFRINHLDTGDGNTYFDLPADVAEEAAGVYSLILVSEPDHMSIQVSDGHPAVNAGGLAVWGRRDEFQRALLTEIDDRGGEILLQVEALRSQLEELETDFYYWSEQLEAVYGIVQILYTLDYDPIIPNQIQILSEINHVMGILEAIYAHLGV